LVAKKGKSKGAKESPRGGLQTISLEKEEGESGASVLDGQRRERGEKLPFGGS